MATNEVTAAKTILTKSEDWEKWFWELKGGINSQIWPYINPDGEALALRQEPAKPTFQEFSQNATSYATLSAVHQKAYDQARKYYNEDMVYYSQQQKMITEARTHILNTVSSSSRSILDPDLTTREWIQLLRTAMKPQEGYMLTKVEDRCIFCGATANLSEFSTKLVCSGCVSRLAAGSPSSG